MKVETKTKQRGKHYIRRKFFKNHKITFQASMKKELKMQMKWTIS